MSGTGDEDGDDRGVLRVHLSTEHLTWSHSACCWSTTPSSSIPAPWWRVLPGIVAAVAPAPAEWCPSPPSRSHQSNWSSSLGDAHEKHGGGIMTSVQGVGECRSARTVAQRKIREKHLPNAMEGLAIFCPAEGSVEPYRCNVLPHLCHKETLWLDPTKYNLSDNLDCLNKLSAYKMCVVFLICTKYCWQRLFNTTVLDLKA